MSLDAELLVALQHGDSLFPSGAGSFSWGLEPLHRDGLLSSEEDVRAFLSSQLHGRWQSFDRPVMAAAHAAAGDEAKLAELDDLVERMTMPAELREGSRRAGAALLSIHARLQTPGAQAFQNAVRDGGLRGHLPVVQGVVWHGTGLGARTAAAMAAHGLVAGILSAAVRLNIIGHAAAQRLRGDLHHDLATMVDTAPPAPADISSFTPLAEIAAMRHPNQTVRLFAT